jgi:hypothetical protein
MNVVKLMTIVVASVKVVTVIQMLLLMVTMTLHMMVWNGY